MPDYYVDTSALVKRYVDEPGSQDLIDRLQSASSIMISEITRVEMYSALHRKFLKKSIESSQLTDLLRQLEEDWKNYHVIEVNSSIMKKSAALIANCAQSNIHVRGYDAVQIASALSLKKNAGLDKFISSDQNQLKAAGHMGLSTVSV